MKFLLRLLILIIVPIFLLALLYGYVLWKSPAPGSADLVRVCREKMVWKNNLVHPSIYLNADAWVPAQTRIGNKKTAKYVTVLLIDRSGSMGSGPESPLELAKSASASFARIICGDDQPMGVMGFDNDVQIMQSITGDPEACANAIMEIPSGGGTDIGDALSTGHQAIRQYHADHLSDTHAGRIIVFSDGQSNPQKALDAADAAKNEGITIKAIGLGRQINEDLMRRIASRETDAYFTLDPGSLGDIYTNIAAEMVPVIGYSGLLKETYHAGAFSLEMLPQWSRTQQVVDENRFECPMAHVFNCRLQYPYVLRAKKVGLFRLALKPAEFSYIKDLQKPDQSDRVTSDLNPPILVISPLLLILLFLPALLYLLWRLWLYLFRDPPIKSERTLKPLTVPEPGLLKIPRIPSPKSREPSPTLYAGIGKQGQEIIEKIAAELNRDRYITPENKDAFHFLALDTRPDKGDNSIGHWKVDYAELPADLNETVEKLNTEGFPEIKSWLVHDKISSCLGSELNLSFGSKGNRWPARLSLFDALEKLPDEFAGAWLNTMNWLNKTGRGRIVIFHSLESGTGSAIAADIGHLIRHALPLEKQSLFTVMDFGLLDMPADHDRRELNQTAYLRELNRNQVTAHIRQSRNYVDSPGPGWEFVNGFTDLPTFDSAFLLQSFEDNRETVESDFLSQIAATGHVFSEESMSRSIKEYFDRTRRLEEGFIKDYIEGPVHTSRIFTIRFPVSELINRMNCRFVMEVLDRLIGVDVTDDGKRFRLKSVNPDIFDSAFALWEDRKAEIEQSCPVYRVFCELARNNRPSALKDAFTIALMPKESEDPPTPESIIRDIHAFATRWMQIYLNGPADATAEAAVDWRAGKVSGLRYMLDRFLEFGHDAETYWLNRTGQSDTQSNDADMPVLEIINVIQSMHQAIFDSINGYITLLLDSGLALTQSSALARKYQGVYRLANDRYHEVGKQLEAAKKLSWQILLDDEYGDPEYIEDTLYSKFLGEFLKRENGFLLRWIWRFDTHEDGVPDLELKLRIEQDYPCSDYLNSPMEVFSILTRIAEGWSRQVEAISIFDKLRIKGNLDLKSLSSTLARLDRESGLQFTKHYPGAQFITRVIFAMLPNLEEPETDIFYQALKQDILSDVIPVKHHDAHSIHFLIVDSVIPIGAVQSRYIVQGEQSTEIPYIYHPEQESERIRHAVETVLHYIPCPEFHPVLKVILAAPMPRNDLIGIASMGALTRDSLDGTVDQVLITGESKPEAVTEKYQGDSYVWALINLAHRMKGVRSAEIVLNQWHSYNHKEKSQIIDRAIGLWREHVGNIPASPERDIINQFILIMELEREQESKRHQEVSL